MSAGTVCNGSTAPLQEGNDKRGKAEDTGAGRARFSCLYGSEGHGYIERQLTTYQAKTSVNSSNPLRSKALR